MSVPKYISNLVRQESKRLGVELTVDDTGSPYFVNIDCPPGYVFGCNGCTTIVVNLTDSFGNKMFSAKENSDDIKHQLSYGLDSDLDDETRSQIEWDLDVESWTIGASR